MYNYNKATTTSLNINTSEQGETIEQKIERTVNNSEPIEDTAPVIYTERKDGIIAGYDVRTDKWEVAIDAMDKVAKTKIAQREERQKKREEEGKVININEKKTTNNEEGGAGAS